MISAPILTLGAFAMLFSQPRLAERALADVAVIRVPRSLEEMYKGGQDDQAGRLTFTFSRDYFWASFGSGTAYKQQLFVSLMAPDASDAEYKEYPKHFSLSYDDRKTISTGALGSGTLTVFEGVYVQNTLREPAHTFIYTDRARRLQITWHAVIKEIDRATGTDLIATMAASFRIKRDPTQQFAEMRDRPRKEAEARASRRAMAMEMLEREGYGPLVPGKPVLRNDVYVEWMIDPEPRFQLLLPLGRVRASAKATRGTNPRPARLTREEAVAAKWAGSVGWREFVEGQWEFSNYDDEYLPFEGIRAVLEAKQTDPAFVYFYYAMAVRVNHEPDLTRLTNLRWFLDGVPEVRRLWREGRLVKGGTPEAD